MAEQNLIPQMADPGQADPLAQLREIHLPPVIETWPPAPGWWLLAIIGLVLLAYLGLTLYRYWQKKQYRREGIRALESLKESYEREAETTNYLEEYSQLLKRVSYSHFPRETVASLTGESWVAFLDKSGNTKEFSMGSGQALIEGNYALSSEFDHEALHKIGLAWIKNHD